MQDLESQLKDDLSKIGLDVKFKLSIRPYSKSYFGRYDVIADTVILYVWETPNGDLYPYIKILLTAVHESIHHKQWNDPNFKRIRGVMHDPEFKRLYNKYSDRAKARVLFKEVQSRYVVPN